MSDRPKTRRVAIREWTCPNHPEGPPTLPADGYEREELTLTEAYDAETVAALAVLVKTARRSGSRLAASLVEQAFGTCCLGHKWKVVGYKTVEVSVYEEFLRSMPLPKLDATSNILLGELGHGDQRGAIRVPVIPAPESTE